MTQFLTDLLGAKEPLFSLSLKRLEQASGHHGTDARLIGDIHEKAARHIKQLGLDPTDTTGPELYRALLARVARDEKHLAEVIGGQNPDDVQTMLPIMKKAWDKADVNKDCWVLKKSAARDMLRQSPPPNVMKRLGYRSVESLLKNENLLEIYGALR